MHQVIGCFSEPTCGGAGKHVKEGIKKKRKEKEKIPKVGEEERRDRRRVVPGTDRWEEAGLAGEDGGRKGESGEEGSVSENPFAFLQHSSRVASCTEGHTSSLETPPPPHTTAQWQRYAHAHTHTTRWPECLHNGRAVSWQPRGEGLSRG